MEAKMEKNDKINISIALIIGIIIFFSLYILSVKEFYLMDHGPIAEFFSLFFGIIYIFGLLTIWLKK